MQSKKAYLKEKTLSKVEIIDKVLNIFSILELGGSLGDPLSPRELVVIRDYMLHGYSLETKRGILLNLNITSANLDQINHKLKKKGFLESHKTNERKKVVNKELLNLKSVFMDGDIDNRMFIINFKHRKNE